MWYTTITLIRFLCLAPFVYGMHYWSFGLSFILAFIINKLLNFFKTI